MLLARMAATLQPPVRPAQSAEQAQLAELINARDGLVRDRTALKNREKNLTIAILKRQCKQRLEQIERHIDALDAEIASLIAAEAKLARCQCHCKIPQKWRCKIPHFAICGSVNVLASISIFRRPAARLGFGRAWPDGLGQEVCMAPQTIAGTRDLNDDGVMKQPIQKRRGYHRTSEDFPPYSKTAVGSEDHRALFLASVDGRCQR